MKKRVTLLIFVTLTLFSCNRMQPAGFWIDFDKAWQREHINDQGPWGGHRAMHWSTNQEGTFDTNRIISFAAANGWTLVDSTLHKVDDMKTWRYRAQTIFPLDHKGFRSLVESANSTYEHFPRWIDTDALILWFKTGSVSIQPGTDDGNEVNGFVMVNRTGNKMTVYHLWGE